MQRRTEYKWMVMRGLGCVEGNEAMGLVTIGEGGLERDKEIKMQWVLNAK